MTPQLTDEILVAYVDGELSTEDAAEVERALQADQKIREAVQIFRDSADWSRRAFDEVLREPVPDRLIHAAIGQANTEEIAEIAPTVAQGSQRRAGLAGLAMAASIALAIGLGGGFGLSDWVQPEESGPSGLLLVGTIEHGALHTALESTTSGTLTEVADAGDFMPMTTFVEREGRYCREFQATLSDANGPHAAFGIACRKPAGFWQVEAMVAAPDPARTDHFVTASGETGDPLQLLIGAMSDSGPISLDDEAAVLASGWK